MTSTPDADLQDVAADSSVDTLPDASEPRFHAAIFLERWKRADPKAEHTIASAMTFGNLPGQPGLHGADEYCRYHEVIVWSDTGPKPPDYGTFHLTAPALGTVQFTEKAAYEPPLGALGWNAGDLLKIATTGAEVPAFALEDTVPAPAILTTYDLPSVVAQQIHIDRSKPLPLEWTPVSTEVFLLLLQFDDAANPRRGLWCFFPGASGSAAVSTAALEHLLESKSVTLSNLYFGGASRKTKALERVDVEMVTWNAQGARVVVE
ncbi:MAG: hypothetical protein ACXVEE_09405 [Polyangiales bacterium]